MRVTKKLSRSLASGNAAPRIKKHSLVIAGAVAATLAGSFAAQAGSLTSIVGPGPLTSPSATPRAPEAINKYTGAVIPNGRVILSWTGDAITDDGIANSDFLAVIDAEPNSTTYGKVIATASLPKIVGANNPGTALGHTSDVHNDPHHNTAYQSYIDPVSGRKYLFAGGVISGNVFRFDITDVRAIPTADIAICGTELTISALTDDFMILPNGHLAVTYMGGHSYYGPGTVTEFAPMRKGVCAGGAPYVASLPDSVQDPNQYLRENSAVKMNSGITRYTPQHVTGQTDAGMEAYPHGMQLTADGNFLVTSDYANPAPLGGSDPLQNVINSNLSFLNVSVPSNVTSLRQFGTTVRVWKANDLKTGPISISQVPNGPRVEDIYFHNTPEGLMAYGSPHKIGHLDATGNFVPHQGAFVASMCGGALYYTSNILAPQSANNGQGPKWNGVYDVGPCSGVSYFQISDDDRYMYLPISGVQSPGDPVYNRDYPGEHDRRVLTLDIRPLLRKGTGAIACNFESANANRPGNSNLGVPNGNPDPLNNVVHNNGASDCPVVVGMVTNNSAMNYASHGGAHFLNTDRAGAQGLAPGKRIFFMDYFVNLDHMGLQGTGSDGDRKIYMVKLNSNGSMAFDTSFRDELTGEVGLAFTGPQRAAYTWPGRGVAGSAKPHAGIFEANGLVLSGPNTYNPNDPANVVTNY